MAWQNATRSNRAFRTALGAGLTALIAAGAAIAAIGGAEGLAERNAGVEMPAPAPATAVRVVPIDFVRSYAVQRRFTGAFEAAQETDLGFEAGGSVTEILVDEGDPVARGDVLARLDTRLLAQERARLLAVAAGLEAEAELARRTDARQRELRARGFATEQRVDDTSLGLARIEAGLAETRAAVASIDVRTEKAELRAPFDGRVSARLLDEGAIAAAGSPVVRLLENDTIRFRAGIAPDAVETLGDGAEVSILTDKGTVPAGLTHLAPRLDPVTRTRLAYFTPTDPSDAVAGLTGEVIIDAMVATDFDGVWVPIEALRQGPHGSWTILVVDPAEPDSVIGLAAVELIRAEEERVFVRGVFAPGLHLVSTGSHRVVPGERVTILPDTEVASWAR